MVRSCRKHGRRMTVEASSDVDIERERKQEDRGEAGEAECRGETEKN